MRPEGAARAASLDTQRKRDSWAASWGRVSVCAAPLGGGVDEFGDGGDVLLRVGDVRDVAGAGERLAGGVWQDGGELVEHHREEGWGLGAIAEQYRTTKAGKGCSVDAENIGVAGFIEESRGVAD